MSEKITPDTAKGTEKSQNVTQKVEKSAPQRNQRENSFPFICLGFREDSHFFYVKDSAVILKFTSFSVINLLNLASLSNWVARFPDKNPKKPTSMGFNLTGAANFLISVSTEIGLYDPNKVRGNGAWQDDGRFVVNLGHCLMVDGAKVKLSEFDSKFCYVRSLKEISPLDVPLNPDEVQLILTAIRAFKWKNKAAPYFLAGWLMLALICGALPIRPHIWLTGKKGMGKSTALERLIVKLIGRLSLVGVGPSTEAGIRQAIQQNAQPIIHDEFEATDKRGIKRIHGVIEYFRSAWSDSDGETFKGTQSGAYMSYRGRTMALVASIIIRLPNEADRSRFSIVELDDHASNPKERLRDKKKINDSLRALSNDLSDKLFARAVSSLSVILGSYEVLANVIAEELSSRHGQQLGMLLAGYWAYENDTAITEEQAKELFLKLEFAESQECEEELSDEAECLNHLLTQRVAFVPDGKTDLHHDSIGHMLEVSSCHSSLLSYGVKVEKSGNYCIAAYKHAELIRFYKDTRWADGGWKDALKRIKGATTNRSVSFGSRDDKGTAIVIPRRTTEVSLKLL